MKDPCSKSKRNFIQAGGVDLARIYSSGFTDSPADEVGGSGGKHTIEHDPKGRTDVVLTHNLGLNTHSVRIDGNPFLVRQD